MHTTIAEFVADLKLMGRGPRTIEGHELELRRLGRWLEENGLAWDAVTWPACCTGWAGPRRPGSCR